MSPLVDLPIETDARSATQSVEGMWLSHPRVSAMAAFDDDTALRVLAAMADVGLGSPEDYAVVGFDDSYQASLWRPALSSVRIDAENHGHRAAHAILGLDKEDLIPTPSVVVVRSTT